MGGGNRHDGSNLRFPGIHPKTVLRERGCRLGFVYRCAERLDYREAPVLRLQVKTRSRSISTTVHRPGTDELYLLIKAWLSDCSSLPSSSLWALDSSSDGFFSSSCLGHWFQEACSALGLSPPVGELWSGRSHRSGGATVALSVDASLPAIVRFGVWDNLASVQPDLDPSVGPFPEALLFFDHVLKPSLAQARSALDLLRSSPEPSTSLLAA